MSEPFLAEIKMFGFNFPPRGWALCDGQILPITRTNRFFRYWGQFTVEMGEPLLGYPIYAAGCRSMLTHPATGWEARAVRKPIHW